MGVFCITGTRNGMAGDDAIVWRNMIPKTDIKAVMNGDHNNPYRISMVVIKGIILFLVFNIAFIPMGVEGLGKLSLYNHLFPGRLRLPFGENPTQSYNLSLDNLDAMFASHVISDIETSSDEYRVFVIGDSSTWGILLKPEETLSGLLNAELLKCDGRPMHYYNLGYPTLSLTKDVMILDQAMQFKPDLIIWLVTLEAFPEDKQLTSPIVESNLETIKYLSEKYGLGIGSIDTSVATSNIFDKTIIGQRRALADLLRLQLYGEMWSATRIDQVYPDDFEPAQIDLKNDNSFHDWTEQDFHKSDLVFDVLDVGKKIAGDIPIILINEPILISNGENSDIRYNFYYPRWVYDQYRELLADYSLEHSWKYYDFWNIVPMTEFTNSAIHLTPAGENILAGQVKQLIHEEVCH